MGCPGGIINMAAVSVERSISPYNITRWSKIIQVMRIKTIKEIDHQTWNVLMFNQILPTSNIGNIWRTVRRICIWMLRLKGLEIFLDPWPPQSASVQTLSIWSKCFSTNTEFIILWKQNEREREREREREGGREGGREKVLVSSISWKRSFFNLKEAKIRTQTLATLYSIINSITAQ